MMRLTSHRGPAPRVSLDLRSGVTLIELLTMLTVGTVIVGGLFAMLLVSQVCSAETLTISKVEYAAKLSVLKLQNEVIGSGVKSPGWSLADGQSADRLTFSRCLGAHEGERVWSGATTFRRDGERLVRDADGAQSSLSDSIQDLRFELSGNVLRIAVTARAGHRDRFSYTAAATADVVLRN